MLLGGIVAFCIAAAPASAANVSVDCKGLQAALTAASAGETITLTELCTKGFPYELPGVVVTFAGTPGAGFSGGTTAQLKGGAASATIEGLRFENGNDAENNGAAGLSINPVATGTTFVLARDVFANEHATPEFAVGGVRINSSTSTVSVIESTFTGDSGPEGGGLAIFAQTATITNSVFETDHTSQGGGGGLLMFLGGAGNTLSGSVFRNDTATGGGGGASIVVGLPGVALTLTGNTFGANSVADPAGVSKSPRYAGGGLSIENEGSGLSTIVQSANTFDSNRVSFMPAARTSQGGGESAEKVILQSTADRFTNNTLQSPNGAETKGVFGWGAGLSVLACGDTETFPPEGPNLRSTLTDAIVAGNTLERGTKANGAGIYVGSSACFDSYAELVLADSTVSGNTVTGAPGPVAGISGGPHDVLSLANTILAGDSGGPEIGGFASATATFSDVCSGAAPFAGTGNICADPALAGAGPGKADVHETVRASLGGPGASEASHRSSTSARQS
jgi:hypothetical protein